MSTVEPEAETLPPPVPGQPPARHRVWRSRDRIVAGVAGGLADALGVAPLWVRLGFVVLAVFGGLGVVAYLAAWLILPAGPWSPPPSLLRRAAGLALIPLWLTVMGPGAGRWGLVDGPFGLVLVLVGVALALWTPRAATAPPSVVDHDRRGHGPGPAPSPASSSLPARPDRPARPPSPLGRMTLGIALLVAAAGTVIGQGSAGSVKVAFAIAALVCGAGLIIGAFAGRARWLVLPALLLAGVSVAGAAVDGLGVRVNGSRNDDFWSPYDGVPAPPVRIDKPGGDTHVQLEAIEAPVDGVIRVGYGDVTISAAEGVHLEVVAHVGLGSIDMPSGSEDGYRRSATYTSGPSDAPLVRYDVAVGFGSIDVWRFEVGEPPVFDPTIGPLAPGVVGSDGAGGVIYEDGTERRADGTVVLVDGSVIEPSGRRSFNSPVLVLPGGEVLLPDGTKVQPDGTVVLTNGVTIEPVTLQGSPPLPPAGPTTVPAATVPASTVPASTVPAQP